MDTNTINIISNYLTSKHIPHTNNYSEGIITTTNLEIRSSLILNNLTGEILMDIPETEDILNYIEIIDAVEISAAADNSFYNK